MDLWVSRTFHGGGDRAMANGSNVPPLEDCTACADKGRMLLFHAGAFS